jgi:short-subunit dehydrogenase
MSKTIMIIGAKSDIARAIAHKFASEGYNLQLLARKIDSLQRDMADLKIRYRTDVECFEFDVLDFKSHDVFIESLPVLPDVVISLVGSLGDQYQSQNDWDACELVLDTNFSGPVSILNVLANKFEERKRGTIVGVSSVAGDRGRQSNYMYGAAKAGFTAYLSGLRNRLSKSNVHVITVKPGFVNTSMTADMDLPERLTAKPEQAADDIYQAVFKKKNTLYTLWFWRYIMLIIKNIPEAIFKKLSL